MKLIAFLIALVSLVAGGYTRLTQTVCGDSNCSKMCTSTTLPLGKCEPQIGGGGLILSCSSDGTSFNETFYNDMKCSKATNGTGGSTKTCFKAGLLEYISFSCVN